MSNFDKMSSAASLPLALLATAVACPIASAQNASRTKTPATTPQKPSGATSSSYAACAPGNPIGGIIVKGGQNPKGPKGKTACPVPAADSEHGTHQEIAPVQPDAAAREGTRTYTGGRRNEDAPSAVVAAPGQPIKGVIVKGGGPNRPASLSIAPTTIKAVAAPAAEMKKSGE